MPDANDFKKELEAQIDRAKRQGRDHVEINAGELHRIVGGYPGSNHRMPVCCAVMRQVAGRNRAETVFETNSGNSASLTIRYFLCSADRVGKRGFGQ